ncbi:hypothetical protein ACFXO9_21725 [Nocardia tengchongensis]|uniref:hypothetical protein n=1 Tax=Nocardia tengchongensis TaxID=2055889 RepID=UPI0036BFF553
MNQPEQSSIASNSPGLLLEVTVVSDAETARRLSRVLALARLRSPYTWGFVLLIPLILMSRRFIEVFIAANSPGWNVSDLFVSYFGLLAVTVVMSLVLTGVQLIKRNASIAAYAAPGTAISARFQQDSLELILTTGTTTIPYSQFKDLFTIGGGVFLREQGTRGRALPGDLFTPPARDLIDKARGRVSATSSTPGPQTLAAAEMAGKRNRNFIIAGMAVVVVVAIGVVAYVGHDGAGGGTQTSVIAGQSSSTPAKNLAPLPFPCALTDSQKQEFGLDGQSLQEDGPKQRRCEWDVKSGLGADYDSQLSRSATALMRIERRPGFEKLPTPKQIRVGNAVDGEEYMINDDKTFALCIVVWPTSFGSAHLEMRETNFKGANGGELCKRAEDLAGALLSDLPR